MLNPDVTICTYSKGLSTHYYFSYNSTVQGFPTSKQLGATHPRSHTSRAHTPRGLYTL